MAFAVRLPRAIALARPHVWPGRGPRSHFVGRPRLPRRLGHGAVPVAVPIVPFPLVLGADARVVRDRRDRGRHVPAQSGMASLPVPGTGPAPDHRASSRPGGDLGRPNPSHGFLSAGLEGSRLPDGRAFTLSVPADGPAGVSGSGRLYSLAVGRSGVATAVLVY